MLDAVDYTDNSGGLRRLDFPHASGFGLPRILVSTKDTSKQWNRRLRKQMERDS